MSEDYNRMAAEAKIAVFFQFNKLAWSQYCFASAETNLKWSGVFAAVYVGTIVSFTTPGTQVFVDSPTFETPNADK